MTNQEPDAQGAPLRAYTDPAYRPLCATLADVRANHGGILSAIRDSRDLSDDTRDKLKAMLDQFVKTFA